MSVPNAIVTPALYALRERLLDLRTDAGRLGPDDLGEVVGFFRMLRHRLAGKHCRHVEGSLLLHEGDAFVVHVGAVFDRSHPRAHRAQDAKRAVRVRGDGEAVIMRGLHDGFQLFVGELGVVGARLHAQDPRGGA